MVERIVLHLGGDISERSIGVLGITFKANTDDLRESPAVEIVRGLVGLGARITMYDPRGMPGAASSNGAAQAGPSPSPASARPLSDRIAGRTDLRAAELPHFPSSMAWMLRRSMASLALRLAMRCL